MNATAARHLLSSVRAKAKSIVKMSTFRGTKDLFGGIIVRSSEEPQKRYQFLFIVLTIHIYLFYVLYHTESLQVWSRTGIRGVWFEVEPASSEWIPVLVQVSQSELSIEICI